MRKCRGRGEGGGGREEEHTDNIIPIPWFSSYLCACLWVINVEAHAVGSGRVGSGRVKSFHTLWRALDTTAMHLVHNSSSTCTTFFCTHNLLCSLIVSHIRQGVIHVTKQTSTTHNSHTPTKYIYIYIYIYYYSNNNHKETYPVEKAASKLLRGTIPTVQTKTFICRYFYSQYLVIFTTVPRNTVFCTSGFYLGRRARPLRGEVAGVTVREQGGVCIVSVVCGCWQHRFTLLLFLVVCLFCHFIMFLFMVTHAIHVVGWQTK